MQLPQKTSMDSIFLYQSSAVDNVQHWILVTECLRGPLSLSTGYSFFSSLHLVWCRNKKENHFLYKNTNILSWSFYPLNIISSLLALLLIATCWGVIIYIFFECTALFYSSRVPFTNYFSCIICIIYKVYILYSYYLVKPI